MSVLVKLRRNHPLGERSYDAFIDSLREKLTGRAQTAYIFGSVARREETLGSDVDLLIVADTELPFVERWKEFSDIVDLAPEIDMLIYTQAEFDLVCDENEQSPFWRSVIADLVPVFPS